MVKLKCVVCGKEAEYVHVHSYCQECFEKRKQILQETEKWSQEGTFLSDLDSFLSRPSVQYGFLGIIVFMCILTYLRGDFFFTILFLVSIAFWTTGIIMRRRAKMG